MAEFTLEKPFISIGGNDLSSSVRSITVTANYAEVDSTTGGDTSLSRIKALGDWQVSVTFQQDFDAASVDSILWTEFNASTNVTIFRPSTDAVGANNPSYTGTGTLSDYTIISGSMGEYAEAPIVINCAAGSMLTRATS